MIYILKESMMNGTVTIDTYTTGIEADSFPEAIKRVLALPNMNAAKNIKETINDISFNFDGHFPVYALMDSTPLKVL